MTIRFFYDNINYRLKGCNKMRKCIEKVIRGEGKIPGDLNFIFTSDDSLLEINRKFLKHNYYTDVITFSEDIGSKTGGEVYISVDTVKQNAKNYKVSYRQEMLRVLFHGTLHLCGYNDTEEEARNFMRGREDYWLRKFGEI